MVLTAACIMFGYNEAGAAFSAAVATPNLSFSISDYQPAPAGVYVLSDNGRPYYVEKDRRVYMEKKKHGKHHKKEKNHHDDRDHKDSHDDHNGHSH
jgi:hypothetical protein